MIELYRYLTEQNFSDVVEDIEKIILNYNLSNTKIHGYEYYHVTSSVGLKDVNKEAYLKLRSDYNNKIFDKDIEPLIFYVLITYGFNNQIRFNSSGDFNMPTGKRDFNRRMVSKLENFMLELKKRNIEYSSKDFRVFLRNQQFKENDFVYLDPPYLISTAVYNENGGWTSKDEIELLEILDDLNEAGIKFALSNLLIHKGNTNKLLEEWSQKYKVHKLCFNYNNSNYQSKAKKNDTVEVLITNY